MSIRKRGCCPNCGFQLVSIVGVGSGRGKSVFLEANGKKKHLDDWAAELKVTPQAINYYRRKYKELSFQEIYNRIMNKVKRIKKIRYFNWDKKK